MLIEENAQLIRNLNHQSAIINQQCQTGFGKMDATDLRERLVQFALRIIRLCASLPSTPEGRLVRGQLIRCGTSPGAQYREACRARSPAEFISKMESCEQELDETEYWLLILERGKMIGRAKLSPLQDECRELIRIFASSVTTAKRNRRQC